MPEHLGIEALNRLAAAEALPLGARQFYFLRHGQTDGNRYKFFQPPTQPLNERGIGQAEHAAALLRGQPVRRITASNMERTRQTAAIVAEALALPFETTPLLRERNFGELIGTSSLLIDWTSSPAGGETLEQFVSRVRAGFQQALAEDDALAIGHGGNLYVLAAALRIELLPQHLANASPLLFEGGDADWRIRTLERRDDEEINIA